MGLTPFETLNRPKSRGAPQLTPGTSLTFGPKKEKGEDEGKKVKGTMTKTCRRGLENIQVEVESLLLD